MRRVAFIGMLLLLAAQASADQTITSNQDFGGHSIYNLAAPSTTKVPATSPELYGGHGAGTFPASTSGDLQDIACGGANYLPQWTGSAWTCGPVSGLFTPDAPLVFGGAGGTHLQLTLGTGLHVAGSALAVDLSTGVSGGQTAYGGVSAGDALTLQGTTFDAVPGPVQVVIGTSAGQGLRLIRESDGLEAGEFTPYLGGSGAPVGVHLDSILSTPMLSVNEITHLDGQLIITAPLDGATGTAGITVDSADGVGDPTGYQVAIVPIAGQLSSPLGVFTTAGTSSLLISPTGAATLLGPLTVSGLVGPGLTKVDSTGLFGVAASGDITGDIAWPAGVLKGASGALTTATVQASGASGGGDVQGPGAYLTALTGAVTGAGPGSAAATVHLDAGATVAGVLPLTSEGAPTGTGFASVTSGTWGGAARAVDLSSADATGTLAAARFPALSGAVTTTAGSTATAFGASAALSVLANATASSAVPAFLAASAGHQVLKSNSGGTALAWGLLDYSELTGTPASLPPSGAAGGSLAGTYPNPTLTALVTAGSCTYCSVTLSAEGRATAYSSGTAPVTSVSGTSGQVDSSGGTTPVISLPNVGPGAGAIGGSGIASITLDAQGRVTAASAATYLTGNQTVTLSGQVTGSGTTSIATSLAANTVTYADLQQVAASSLLGNPTGSTANASGITLGAGLAFSGSTLVNTSPSPASAISGLTFPLVSGVPTLTESGAVHLTALDVDTIAPDVSGAVTVALGATDALHVTIPTYGSMLDIGPGQNIHAGPANMTFEAGNAALVTVGNGGLKTAAFNGTGISGMSDAQLAGTATAEPILLGTATQGYISADPNLTWDSVAARVNITATGTYGWSGQTATVGQASNVVVAGPQFADAGLSAGGMVKADATSGQLAIAVPGSDYADPLATYLVASSSHLPTNGVNLGALSPGLLYQAVSGGVSTPAALNLTAGSIVYGGSGGAPDQDNANLFWDEVHQSLGVGTNTPNPSAAIHLNKNIDASVGLFVTNPNTGSAAGVSMRVGTDPTNFNTGPNLGLSILGTGFGASGLLNAYTGLIEYNAPDNLLLSAYQGDMVVTTTASRTERMRIAAGGNVSIASLSAGGIVKALTSPGGQLAIAGSADITNAITWPTGFVKGVGGGIAVASLPTAGELMASNGTTADPVGDAFVQLDTTNHAIKLSLISGPGMLGVNGSSDVVSYNVTKRDYFFATPGLNNTHVVSRYVSTASGDFLTNGLNGESPNDFLAGKIYIKFYLAESSGTATTMDCWATRNGTTISGTDFNFTPGTTPVGVNIIGPVATGAGSASDTYGYKCLYNGTFSGGPFGAAVVFAAQMILTTN